MGPNRWEKSDSFQHLVTTSEVKFKPDSAYLLFMYDCITSNNISKEVSVYETTFISPQLDHSINY